LGFRVTFRLRLCTSSFILSPLSVLGAIRFLSFVLGGPPKGLYLSLVSFVFLSFLTCLEEGIAASCSRLRCYEGGGWALGSRSLIFRMRG